MKNTITFFYFFTCFFTAVQAQISTWEMNLSKEKSLDVYSAKPFEDGFFLTGGIFETGPTFLNGQYNATSIVYKISNAGVLLDTLLLDFGNLGGAIEIYDNRLFRFVSVYDEADSLYELRIYESDFNFGNTTYQVSDLGKHEYISVHKEISYHPNSETWIFMPFVLPAYLPIYSWNSDGNVNLHRDSFFSASDQAITVSHFDDSTYLSLEKDRISSGVVHNYLRKRNLEGDVIMQIREDTIWDLYIPSKSFSRDVLKAGDKVFTTGIVGGFINSIDLFISVLSADSLKPIKYNLILEPDIDEQVQFGHSLSTYDGSSVFAGCMTGVTTTWGWPNVEVNDNMYYLLTKMDSEGNVLWTRHYAEGKHNELGGILALSDGGCVMYGAQFNGRYDIAGEPIRDLYLIKVDGNGNFEPTGSNDRSKISWSLFPNPATEYIILQGENLENKDVQLFDLHGKMVHQQSLQQNNMVHLHQLSNGMYLIRVTEKGKLVYSDRLIVSGK